MCTCPVVPDRQVSGTHAGEWAMSAPWRSTPSVPRKLPRPDRGGAARPLLRWGDQCGGARVLTRAPPRTFGGGAPRPPLRDRLLPMVAAARSIARAGDVPASVADPVRPAREAA